MTDHMSSTPDASHPSVRMNRNSSTDRMSAEGAGSIGETVTPNPTPMMMIRTRSLIRARSTTPRQKTSLFLTMRRRMAKAILCVSQPPPTKTSRTRPVTAHSGNQSNRCHRARTWRVRAMISGGMEELTRHKLNGCESLLSS